jgi:hypothetical protein
VLSTITKSVEIQRTVTLANNKRNDTNECYKQKSKRNDRSGVIEEREVRSE